jgi:citrate lyase alpha subunit
LRHAGLPLLTIEDLARRAAYEAETPRPIQPSDAPVVAESYDRHGVLRDVVRVVRPLGHQ